MGKKGKPRDSFPRLLYFPHSRQHIGTIIETELIVYFFAPQYQHGALAGAEVFKDSAEVFGLAGIDRKIFDYFEHITLNFKAQNALHCQPLCFFGHCVRIIPGLGAKYNTAAHQNGAFLVPAPGTTGAFLLVGLGIGTVNFATIFGTGISLSLVGKFVIDSVPDHIFVYRKAENGIRKLNAPQFLAINRIYCPIHYTTRHP
jgi:hypothetical protein